MEYIKQKPIETTLTLKKITDNFFAHLVLILCILGFVFICVLILAVRTVVNQAAEQAKAEAEITENGDTIYRSDAALYINTEDLSAIYFDTLDKNSIDPAQAQLLANAYAADAASLLEKKIFVDCAALIHTSVIVDELNRCLEKQGFEEIQDTDTFGVESTLSPRIIYVSTSSLEEEKALFICAQLSDILIDTAKKMLNIERLNVISNAKMRNLAQTEEEESENGTVSLLKNFIKAILSKTNIVIMFLGLLLSGGLLFLFILSDKKLHSPEDLINFTSCPFIGELTKKNRTSSLEVAAASVQQICADNGYREILVVSAMQEKGLVGICTDLSKAFGTAPDGAALLCNGALNTSAKAVSSIKEVDAVLLVIFGNDETESDLLKALNTIELNNGNVMGCIYND